MLRSDRCKIAQGILCIHFKPKRTSAKAKSILQCQDQEPLNEIESKEARLTA